MRPVTSTSASPSAACTFDIVLPVMAGRMVMIIAAMITAMIVWFRVMCFSSRASVSLYFIHLFCFLFEC